MALLQPKEFDQFESLVERMFGEWPFLAEIPRWTPSLSVPAVDLYEKDGKYVLEMAVPGYDPKDISLEVSGNTLTVSGHHADTSEKKDAKYHRKEMRRGSFTRTVSLPQDIDAEKVDAQAEKGVLKIQLSPVTPISPKKIAIKGCRRFSFQPHRDRR